MEKRLAMCGICGDKCFVELGMENEKVVRCQKAQGRKNIKGGICLRGAAMKQFIHHPDRVLSPLLRVGEKGSGQFRPISWDEAFDIIGKRLKETRETDGARATVFYAGHPKWLRYMLSELAIDYGSPNFCTESGTCNTAPRIAHSLIYGREPLPADSKNCGCMLVWGANPAYSKLSTMNGVFSVPERGGKLIVVDPRCTPTTERATLHLRPRHGTDCALALAIANVIISEGLEDKDYIEKYSTGFEEFKACAAQFTPEKAESITGVPASQIVEAARMIAVNTPLSVYTSSCGFAHSVNGVQAYRAVFLLEALTGSYDVPGGNHGPMGKGASLLGFHHSGRERCDIANEFTRGRFPLWNEFVWNEGQSMGMAEAILSAEPYAIRNVIGFGMNHKMFPASQRMEEALRKLEFFVDTDFFLTDTAKLADIALPAQPCPEKEYVYLGSNDHLFYLPAAVKQGDTRNDVEIMLGIARALGLEGELTGMRSFDEYMNWMLSPTGVTLEQLKAHPEGLPAQKLKEGGIRSFERGLNTPGGKIEFASEVSEKYGFGRVPEYKDKWELNPDREKYPYELCIGVRRPQFFQSRTYRIPWLAGLEDIYSVSISPEDAAKLKVENGDKVKVSTPMGEAVYNVLIDSGALPGNVYLPNDQPQRDGNRLIDADCCDPISGFPVFRCWFCGLEAVEVEK